MAVLGFLTAWHSQSSWTSYMVIGFNQRECSTRPGGSYKTSYTLILEVKGYHILLIKAVIDKPRFKSMKE